MLAANPRFQGPSRKRQLLSAVAGAVLFILLIQLAVMGMGSEEATSPAPSGAEEISDSSGLREERSTKSFSWVRWVVPGIFAFADCEGSLREPPRRLVDPPSSSRPPPAVRERHQRGMRADVAIVTSLTLHYKANPLGRTPAKRAKGRTAIGNEEEAEGMCSNVAAAGIMAQLAREERDAKGAYFQDSREMARVSIENKLQYSHIHHYPFFFYHSHLLDRERSPTWAKIQALQAYLPQYEWLLWMDMDAFFMGMATPIEAVIDLALAEKPDADLIVTNDWNGLNNGVFLIRRCSWSIAFLEEVWESYYSLNMRVAIFHEQDAMQELLKRPEHRQHAAYVPLHAMNSFAPRIKPDKDLPADFPRYSYEHGDFILHTPGLHVHEKLLAVEEAQQGTQLAVNLQPGTTNWRIEIQDFVLAE